MQVYDYSILEKDIIISEALDGMFNFRYFAFYLMMYIRVCKVAFLCFLLIPKFPSFPKSFNSLRLV